MSTLTHSEVEEINNLSYSIDTNKATLNDYVKYEELLLKAGLTKDDVTSKMRSYGYTSYNQYLDARAKAVKKAVTQEQRRIVNVLIVAGLVVLSSIVLLLIAKGRVKVSD